MSRRSSAAATSQRSASHRRPGDLGAGSGALEHAMASGDRLDVLLDLGLRREAPRPARVRFEGELVQVRGHVARRTRIGVVRPHAAEALAALEDRHVGVARAGEQHRRADAAEAASDDRHRRTASPPPPACGGPPFLLSLRLRAHAVKTTPRDARVTPASASRGALETVTRLTRCSYAAALNSGSRARDAPGRRKGTTR